MSELEVKHRHEMAMQQEAHGQELQQATEAVSASGKYIQQVKAMLMVASDQGQAAVLRTEQLESLLSEARRERDEAVEGLEESKHRLNKLEQATVLLARSQREVLGPTSHRELEALRSKYEILKKRYAGQAQAQLWLQEALLATKEPPVTGDKEEEEDEEEDEDVSEGSENNGAVSEEFSFGHQHQEEQEDEEEQDEEEQDEEEEHEGDERYRHDVEEEDDEDRDEDETEGHRYLSSRSSDVTDYTQYAEVAGNDNPALDDAEDEEADERMAEGGLEEGEEEGVEKEEELPLEESQASQSLIGRRVPPNIIIWAAQYAGDEGLARPSSASPSR